MPLEILLQFKWAAFGRRIYVRQCVAVGLDFVLSVAFNMTQKLVGLPPSSSNMEAQGHGAACQAALGGVLGKAGRDGGLAATFIDY